MNTVVWSLPCKSQEFNEGPRILQDASDQLAIAYDFELENGDYGWDEIRFRSVLAFRFTLWRYCTEDQVTSYDRLQVVADSTWAASIPDRPPTSRHFRIFFDEIGCYEVLASDFVGPPHR